MKRKLARLFSIFAAVCLLCALSSCAHKSKKAAIFLYNSEDTFIAEMTQYMTVNAPEGLSFEVYDAGNSQSVQNQQIAKLIDSGFDLFIINAVDRLACSSIVEKCAQEGPPIIFLNREPLEDALTGSNVFYVGAAADSLGSKQADMVSGLFKGCFAGSKYDKNKDGAIQIVILKGEQGHQDAEKRTDYCISRIKELGFAVDVLGVEVADWNRSDAYESMQKLYGQYGDSIELVFSNNDDMALGAIDFLLEEGVVSAKQQIYDQSFVIVGVDGTTVGLGAIEKGMLYGTVNNDSVKQSDAVLTLAEYILESKSFDNFPYDITNGHYIYIDGDIITKENLSDFKR